MQPAQQRIGLCLDEFRLRMGCSGAHPLLWLEAREIPAQSALGNQRHYPLCTKCSLLFHNLQKSDCTSEQLSWKFSHSKKRRLFYCMWSQHKDNSISWLFLCPYKWGVDPDNFKWLTDLPRKGVFYLMGKGVYLHIHIILMLFLQRFRNEWWLNFLLGIFVFDFYWCPSA